MVAGHAAAAGFDGVEPHGAHGYLLNQFAMSEHQGDLRVAERHLRRAISAQDATAEDEGWLGLVLAAALLFAAKQFYVYEDPRIGQERADWDALLAELGQADGIVVGSEDRAVANLRREMGLPPASDADERDIASVARTFTSRRSKIAALLELIGLGYSDSSFSVDEESLVTAAAHEMAQNQVERGQTDDREKRSRQPPGEIGRTEQFHPGGLVDGHGSGVVVVDAHPVEPAGREQSVVGDVLGIVEKPVLVADERKPP